MKLSEYAKQKGVHYRTALKWYHAGIIPGAYQLSTGTILVEPQVTQTSNEVIVTYARVSNASRRNELEYQVTRLASFCEAKGWSVARSYKEVASGMNDTRKQLWRMLESSPAPTKIVIENKDRLTRFGFSYLERLLKKQDIEIVVINASESDEQDLMRDLVSIITSFCCRLYGLRRGYNKAKQIRTDIEN